MNKAMILAPMAILCACMVTSCSDDGNDIGYAAPETINMSDRNLSFSAEGGVAVVNVACSHEFAIFSKADWLSVSPSNSIGTEADITITAEANTSSAERSGVIVIWSGGSRDSVSVSQAAPAVDPGEEIDCPIDGYKLVWHDEFDGAKLSSDWTAATGRGDNGWGNNELQYYTSSNASVADGLLTITLQDDGDQVTSSRLYAKVETGWRYGYIEAKIKLPTGKGTWPAFWMMPVNFTSWPGDGEIDIMEEVGYDANVVHSTIHCNKYNNTGTAVETARRTVSTAQSEFHVYALLWTADKLTFFVDGSELLSYANDGSGRDAWPFDSAFYPILNLAWGGGWGGQQGLDASCLPAQMQVDYVRVFQLD